MTRDFNKPRRDAFHSSFRNSSPNRNRDERSPRPRLNRETVDRAWESGAQQQHADYRPRTGGGQSRPQGQRNGSPHNSPNRQDYSSHNGRGGGRPYNNNRQDNFRDNHSNNYRDDRSYHDSSRNFDRQSGSNNAYRPARPPYQQERRDFDGQRFENRRNSFESPNRRGNANRQQFQDRGNSRRNFADNDRPHLQNRPGGPERNFNRRYNDADERFEGDYEQFDERNTHSARSIDRGYEGRTSRPQRSNGFDDRDTRNTRPSREGRFEDRDNRDMRPARPTERPFSGNRSFQDKPERRSNEQRDEAQPEKHVTRLPDGRVLKGSRGAQRKKAQFWTGVTADTNELVNHVQEAKPDKQTQTEQTDETPSADITTIEVLSTIETPVTDEQLNGIESEDISTEGSISEVTPPKRRTRTASAVTRTKKPRSTGPKPSQRGFKWPTQE